MEFLCLFSVQAAAPVTGSSRRLLTFHAGQPRPVAFFLILFMMLSEKTTLFSNHSEAEAAR